MNEGRKSLLRAIYGCGGGPIDDYIADDWCTDYHCVGDCGLRGHGYQHAGHGDDTDLKQQEWVISGMSDYERQVLTADVEALARGCGFLLTGGRIESPRIGGADLRDLLEAMIQAERQRIISALPGGTVCDPQQVADMVRWGAA